MPPTFKFIMQRMEWAINGHTFEMTAVAEEDILNLNTTEVWKLINSSMMEGYGMMGDEGMMGDQVMMQDGGMMGNIMQMSHLVHIHQVQFNFQSKVYIPHTSY